MSLGQALGCIALIPAFPYLAAALTHRADANKCEQKLRSNPPNAARLQQYKAYNTRQFYLCALVSFLVTVAIIALGCALAYKAEWHLTEEARLRHIDNCLLAAKYIGIVAAAFGLLPILYWIYKEVKGLEVKLNVPSSYLTRERA